jgi:hypothetical protein
LTECYWIGIEPRPSLVHALFDRPPAPFVIIDKANNAKRTQGLRGAALD